MIRKCKREVFGKSMKDDGCQNNHMYTSLIGAYNGNIIERSNVKQN